MNGNNLLIDTNIALYLLDGNRDIAAILDGKNIYISFVTQLELLGYKDLQSNEIDVMELFISNCIIIDINQTIKDKTIQIRRTNKVKLPDAIIAATSQYLNIPLLSADIRMGRINNIQFVLFEI
jgi:hypothetical protein